MVKKIRNLLLKKNITDMASFPRNVSYTNCKKIIPSYYGRSFSSTSSSSFVHDPSEEFSDRSLVVKGSPVAFRRLSKHRFGISSLFKSIISLFSFPGIFPSCRWMMIPGKLSITPSLGKKVSGTLFGYRRGLVSFAVQDDSKAEPVLLIELAMSTANLVKEMSSGLVRIALECEKSSTSDGRPTRLFSEPAWTMYCNGRKSGHALSRACNESDWHVLSTIQSVSVGAGVIPVVEDGSESGGSEGELLYMRAKFERVVGSRDSEAFYMMNPDGTGGPELSLFLLRI